jgi:1-deoxy-D-xylulose-5-phosphate synthase
LPVCAIYSTFLQRAYDQVVHDVCLPKLPVVFAIDRAGLVGADGATHQGAYDLSFLRPLPGMGIAAPVWGEDLGPLLDAALASGGPFALRFPRGTLPAADATRPPVVSTRPAAVATGQPLCRSGLPAATESAHPAEPQTDGARSPGEQFACGSGLPTATALRARWLKKVPAPTLTIIALGPLGLSALEAAATEPWNVLDALSLSPLDTEAITEASRSGRLITVEEGTSRGGLGSAVLEHLSAHHHPCQVTTLGLPDRFIRHGDARAQRKVLGLDADGIRRAAQALLDSPE